MDDAGGQMSQIKIKNCGLNSADAVEAALASAADFLGFIHYPDSPRHSEPRQVAQWLAAAEYISNIVAVTVNPTDSLLQEIVDAYTPNYFQLHGDESPERIAAIKARFGLPIIKAIPIETVMDLDVAEEYEDCVEFLLFDTKAPAGEVSGGTGRSFDWRILEETDFIIPVFLSGGLNINNIEGALRTTRARYIDISSGLESSRGVKDPQKIHAFNEKVRRLETD